MVCKNRHIKKEKKLFHLIMEKNKFTTDKELGDFILISPSMISQLRNDHFYISPRLILQIYYRTDFTIEEIRKLIREDV